MCLQLNVYLFSVPIKLGSDQTNLFRIKGPKISDVIYNQLKFKVITNLHVIALETEAFEVNKIFCKLEINCNTQ